MIVFEVIIQGHVAEHEFYIRSVGWITDSIFLLPVISKFVEA